MKVARRAQWQSLMAIAAVCAVVLALIFAGYKLKWAWMGFDKTLWDWMQLLIIPVVLTALGIAAIRFNRIERKHEQEMAADNLREVALQAYLDRMTELLLEKNLRSSTEDSEVRYVARARTLTVLPQLDSKRKSSVMQFLIDSQLISFLDLDSIDLENADLSGVNLNNANLSGVNLNNVELSGANLSGVNLRNAKMSGAELSGVNLSNAKLFNANLSNTNLAYANLTSANLSDTNLRNANLRNANLSDTNLSHADLRNADLSHADLTLTKLMSADLKDATMISVKMFSTLVTEAQLHTTKIFSVEKSSGKE